MELDLCSEALEFGRHALRAFEAAGGDQLVQRAESDPAGRQELIEPVMADLGAWDLDVRGSGDELEAAAALCRAAGYWSVPYPLAERLCRPADMDVDGLLAVGPVPAAAVAGLQLKWAALSLAGGRSLAFPRSDPQPARKTAFVAGLDLEPHDHAGAADVPLLLALPCWTLLGILDRAMTLTCAYVQDRQQFGQKLATFQGVQFQLTDAEVERAGLEELAKYALWSIQQRRPEALDDAVALRLAALEASEAVFRVTHQLHGAIGFCDETTLSWLSRYSVPLRRLPLNLSATRSELAGRLGRTGLAGLFDRAAFSSEPAQTR